MTVDLRNSALVKKVISWRANAELFILDNFNVKVDAWQKDVCVAWDRGDQRIAMCACKGPGKTALLAMLIWQFISTRRRSNVAATSISGDNLRDCLWTELARWRDVSDYLKSTFEWQKERIVAKDNPEFHWASARTWSKSADIKAQADTLAGLHSKYILFVIDEAGGVPDAVSVSAEAALSTGAEVRFLIAGNPTECEGPLWRACGRDRAIWTVVNITGDPDDPKRSPRISIKWAREQIEQHGANNPWVLANVFGKFPPSSPNVFIAHDLYEAAVKRDVGASLYDPLVLGVDVARFGDDSTVFRYRKGPDGRTHQREEFRNLDNMQVAARVAQRYEELSLDAIFVDGGGNGGGVIDRLHQLNILNVFEVQFGAKSDRLASPGDVATYDNKAAEIWGQMKAWLKHGSLDDSADLRRDLIHRRYFYNQRYGRDALALESKEDMRKRGLPSPNDGDALALTFAYPVQKTQDAGRFGLGATHQVTHEYDPMKFLDEHMKAA